MSFLQCFLSNQLSGNSDIHLCRIRKVLQSRNQFCEGTVMTCTYTVGAGSGQDVSPLDVTSVNTTLCSAGWTQQSIAGLNTTASVHTRVYSSASIHKAGKNYICFSTGIGVGGTPFKVFRQIDTGSPDKEEMIGPDSPIISIYSKST